MSGPLRTYGGKGQMLGKLLPLLPPHTTYVEPFAGGASLFFGKAPAAVEVLNDIDQGLVHFYRVLRDPAGYAGLVQRLAVTPYARAEWQDCRQGWAATIDPIERAARWFVWVRQQHGGGGQAQGGWQRCITESARGMSSAVNAWLSAIDGLPAIHARLQQVQVECLDWRAILPAYDAPATLFYCDPPYLQETRGRHRYTHELSRADHIELVAVLLTLQGMVILSGYASDVYTPLEAAGWQRIDWPVQVGSTNAGTRPDRVESVWLSPSCARPAQGVLL